MIPSTVNICGVPHKVIKCKDNFDIDMHFGMIDYVSCEIKINEEMTEPMQKQSLIHEMVHGMLIHIGQDDLARDEEFVQTLATAIFLGFEVKAEDEK